MLPAPLHYSMDELNSNPFPQNGTKALFKALSKWQHEHTVVKKDADGRFKYASLEVVTHYVSSATAYGLSHYFRTNPVQNMASDEGPTQTLVSAYLIHEDGGHIWASLTVDDYNPKNSQDRNQQRGSSMTYARRQLLGLLYGIATGDKDLDAEEQPPAPTQAKVVKKAAAKPAPEPAADSNLISPNVKDGLVVRIAPMEADEREALMLAFKAEFNIRCNETRSNPKGIPNRDHITLKEHGDWFDIQLRERAERLKKEIKEQ
jgi:hypothetical protein